MKLGKKVITGARLGALCVMSKVGDAGVNRRQLLDLGYCTTRNITHSPIRGMLKDGMIFKRKVFDGPMKWHWNYTLSPYGAEFVIFAYDTTNREYFIPSVGRYADITKEMHDYARAVIARSKDNAEA